MATATVESPDAAAARRTEMVRRLLDKGLSPAALAHLLPEWRSLVEAACESEGVGDN